MKRISLAAGALAAVLAWAGVAGAQSTAFNGSIGYPTRQPYDPANQGQMPYAYQWGSGTDGYLNQNPGAGMGSSPTAYYSRNYFTAPPAVVRSPTTYYSPSGYYPSTYGARGGWTPTTGYATSNYVATPTSRVYSQADSTYYRNRRTGPLRRVFGGR